MLSSAVPRFARALCVIAALLAAATACSGETPAPSTGDLSSVTLRVGATGWATAQAALQVAGLDQTPYQVRWAVFPGGDKQLQALQAGALDLTESSEIPPIFAAASGNARFKVVAVQRATTLQQEVVVGAGSPITSIAELKGKKVGYVPNTTAHYFLDRLLERAGLHWGDIVAAPLSPNDGVTALSGGAIDALASYGNSIITVHLRGGRMIGDGSQILSGNFPWEAETSAIADPGKRAAIVDLLARISQAYAVIRAGRMDEFARRTAEATHEDQALDQLRAEEAQRPTTIVPTSPEAVSSEQAVADTFAELRIIPNRLDVAGFWTDALNTELNKALLATPAPGR
jgi:sulfonate transport system substrate-binding protein